MTVSGFNFDERTHTYSQGGIVVPGCTRILDHAGLSNYDMVRADILERRSALGRAVHSACHFLDEGDLDWTTVVDSARGYIESWGILCEDMRFVPRIIEHQCIAEIDGMPYGMKIDREGLINGEEAIIEIKITRQIHASHGIQLAGYALGLPHAKLTTPMARFMNRRRFVAKLDEHGKKARLASFDSKTDAGVFTAGLVISHWKMLSGYKISELEEAA